MTSAVLVTSVPCHSLIGPGRQPTVPIKHLAALFAAVEGAVCKTVTSNPDSCESYPQLAQPFPSISPRQSVPSACPVQEARLARAVRVSGWSGPETRSMTGSRAANWSRAPAASPACPVQEARLARAVRVSGWSGPETRSRTGSRAAYWSRAPAGSPAAPM
jgi:hypothetical protein